MSRFIVTALILLAGVTCVHAQDDQKIDRMTVDTMEVFTPDTIKWKDEPILPKGAQSALVVGDPNKSGVFIAYLRFPANYVIPAHTHPFAEVITVLRGNLGNGMGEKFEPQRGEILAAGSSFTLPAGHAHYDWTTEDETIVELIATGPWDISYMDPNDDPRRKQN